MQQFLLSEGSGLTLGKATAIAIAMETSSKQSSEIQKHQDRVSETNLNKLERKSDSTNVKSDSSQACFRCGSRHLALKCLFKDEECFFLSQ